MRTPPPRTRAANLCQQQHNLLAEKVKQIGIREFARRSGLGPMLLSRFCSGRGATDAWTHYAIAATLGLRIELVPVWLPSLPNSLPLDSGPPTASDGHL